MHAGFIKTDLRYVEPAIQTSLMIQSATCRMRGWLHREFQVENR